MEPVTRRQFRKLKMRAITSGESERQKATKVALSHTKNRGVRRKYAEQQKI